MLPPKLKYVPSFAVGYGWAQRADVFSILYWKNKAHQFLPSAGIAYCIGRRFSAS